MVRGLLSKNKFCYKCDLLKDLTEFSNDKSTKSGLSAYCKKCRGKMKTQRDYTRRRIDPEWRDIMKTKDRNRYYKREYGITLQDYDSISFSQNHVCAICQKPNCTTNGRNKASRLCVDHCHKTNKIRGLLYHSCNAALGHFKDDINILDRAKDYLALSR